MLDSVSRQLTKISRLETTPQATAKLNLDPNALAQLPRGAVFQSKDKNATATVRVAEDGTIEITAHCDSLSILVDEFKEEIYHLKANKTAFKSSLNKEKTKELSSWQNFQILGFRIGMCLLIIYIIIRKIKTKWQRK